ncbi:MAG: ZIP family metal transporter [Proteobacteria bacterium]|nr:ZIP family metal transporter [Pseudomonadota bacterium]
MDYLTLKILSIFAIFGVGLLGGLVPVTRENVDGHKRLFSLGAAFSGGIFVGAGLIHMLPDANEGFTDALKNVEYPLAFLICAVGFLLILFLDKILFGDHDATTNQNIKSRTPYILAIILSVHSVIAGIALGVDGSTTSSLIILVAILSHKGSAAFALGVNLAKHNVLKKQAQKTIYLFCLMTPLGVITGLILHHFLLHDNQKLLEAIFDSVAAGTFLYVAILEIIREEFSSPSKTALAKFFFLGAGLLLMAALAIFL